MKKTLMLIALMVGLTVSANATLIDLGYTWGSPASPTAELGRLNTQIGLYNNLYNPDLPSVIGWTAEQTQVEGDVTSISLNLTGFDGYLMFKYGPIDRFFYVSGLENYTFLSDVYDFTHEFNLNKPKGLSHYTQFHPVPEPATWITGLALFFPFAMSTMRIFRPNLIRS